MLKLIQEYNKWQDMQSMHRNQLHFCTLIRKKRNQVMNPIDNCIKNKDT